MTREELTSVLTAEVDRWSAKPYSQLRDELRDEVHYTVEHHSATCQVEAMLIENRDDYLHVLVSVSDETFWRSVKPLSQSFLVHRDGHCSRPL